MLERDRRSASAIPFASNRRCSAAQPSTPPAKPLPRSHARALPTRRRGAARRGRRPQVVATRTPRCARSRGCCSCARRSGCSPICARSCRTRRVLDASPIKARAAARRRHHGGARAHGRHLFRRQAAHRDRGDRRLPLQRGGDRTRGARRPRSSRAARRRKLTSVDKANVLETSRLWRAVVERILPSEFPDVSSSTCWWMRPRCTCSSGRAIST